MVDHGRRRPAFEEQDVTDKARDIIDWDYFEKNRSELGPGFIRILSYFKEDGTKSIALIEQAMHDHNTTALVIPAHAFAENTSGRGWRCEEAYRESGGNCVAVRVPANAYATGSWIGAGWKCERGFEEVDGACVVVVVPVNAALDESGTRWHCYRGFVKTDKECTRIEVPENGYLDSSGAGWRCERGFAIVGKTCVSLNTPANAHVTLMGRNWVCNESYHEVSGACVVDTPRARP